MAETELHLGNLRIAREGARTRDEEAGALLLEATIADEFAEETFKRFGPLWSEAERLDAELVDWLASNSTMQRRNRSRLKSDHAQS